VQTGFQGRRIISFNNGMNIKREGNRGVTKLFYTIQRLQTTCHTYFVYIFAKRTNTGDNVYVVFLCLCEDRVNFTIECIHNKSNCSSFSICFNIVTNCSKPSTNHPSRVLTSIFQFLTRFSVSKVCGKFIEKCIGRL